MVTLSGWPGLAGAVFCHSAQWPRWTALPHRKGGNETVAIRARPGQPKEDAGVVARWGSTFYSFADIEIARRILEKKQGNNPDLSAILSFNQEMDTYGVLLNKQDSLMRFLEWVNKRDFEAAKASVAKKLTNLFKHVELVTWQGDLIHMNRMDM